MYGEEDVQAILRASVGLGNGAELYAACRRLVEFAAYLHKTNGAAAAQTLATQVLMPLAERLGSTANGNHFRDQARQLAQLGNENSSTSGAFARPVASGIGLRRRP